MRALVTGACGFVGGYLVRHLLECGDEVVATLLPGRPFSADPSLATQCRLVELDVCDTEACTKLVSQVKPDVLYHLAGLSFVPEAETNFARALAVNVAAVDNVCRMCQMLGPHLTLLFVSSGEVYGRITHEELPIGEQCPIRPANHYSLTKAMAELVLAKYRYADRFRQVTMRPFNHIGAGQDERFVVSNFAQQLALIALGKREAHLRVGNLSVRRDFTDVRDIVRAYRLAAQSGQGVYNLGSSRAVAISEIVDLLIEIADIQVKIEVDPARMRPVEIPEVYADTSRARKELGWEPHIELKESLRDVYRYWLAKTSDVRR